MAQDKPDVKFQIRPWGGPAFPDQSELKKEMLAIGAETAGFAILAGQNGAVTTITDPAFGMAAGLEIGYKLQPADDDKDSLGISLKGGMLLSPKIITTATAGGLKTEFSFSTSLLFFMTGIWVESGKPMGFHHRASFHVGWGLSSAEFADLTSATSLKGSGGGLVFEGAGEWGYAVAANVRIFVQASYLIAKIKKHTFVDDSGNEAVMLRRNSTNPLPVNFSGLGLRLGTGLSF